MVASLEILLYTYKGLSMAIEKEMEQICIDDLLNIFEFTINDARAFMKKHGVSSVMSAVWAAQEAVLTDLVDSWERAKVTEGKVNKGGVNSPPVYPKPDFKPCKG